MNETPEKPHGSPGRRLLNGAADGVPFSSQNQPSPAQKKKGWARKKVGKQLAQAISQLNYVGASGSQLKAQIAQTFEMMMLLRQAEKGINKADTFAFNAFMDRLHGKPVQHTDITSNNKGILTEKSDEELAAILRETLRKIDDNPAS